MAIPSSRSSRGEGHQRFGGAPERLRLHDLRADVAVQSDDLEPVAAAHRAAHLAHVADGDAELVALQAGRDVRVALRVDVRIDAHGDAGAVCRAPAIASIRSISPSDSALIVFSPRLDGALELGVRLADAGEDDLRA